MNRPYIIGIAGGSGSGKTHFLNQLVNICPKGSLALFSMDNYYLSIDKQQKDENGIENFDIPSSINELKFFDDLTALINGDDIIIPEYQFNHLDRKPGLLTIAWAPTIIVEGLFTLHFPRIQELLDLRIYIETPEYLMVKRRIIRDAEERGYDLNDVLYRFENHVMPAYNRYILPSREKADLVIPNHDNFDLAVEAISYIVKDKARS